MSPGSKLRWLWRAPARALGRARDMYVRGVTRCARYAPGGDVAAFGYPVSFVPASLSRSGSTRAEEDLLQLVRAASQRRVVVEQRRAEEVRDRAVARSRSAALSMARIDEDAPCEFGDAAGAMRARSRSCVGGGGAARRAHGHGKAVPLG